MIWLGDVVLAQVLAVVVTYNRKDMLQKCLECLWVQTEPCDVLVVDNASTDGTGQLLKELAAMVSGLEVYTTDENLGGAGGFHHGLRLAKQRPFRWVWLMDDDTWPRPDTLERLLEAQAKLGDGMGWLSSQALWQDGTLCKMNIQRGTPYKKLADFTQPLVPAEMATFVSLLLPRCVLEEFGLPVAAFFIWSDDLEYTRRISLCLPCYVVTASKVTHAMRDNTGSNLALDDTERLGRYRLAFRNEYCVYRREGIGGLAYYAAKCLLNTTRVLLKAKTGRRARLAALWAGMRSGPELYRQIRQQMIIK